MNRDEEIYAAALEVAAGDRGLFLDGACGGDPAVRARIAALLTANDEAEEFFALPPVPRPPLVAAEKPGDRIGRYKLLQKIGEGGCGVVYMAEQQEPVRRRVALKVIKLGMDTKAVIARFEAERQALALMDHPNIARVLDAGATETGRPFFVMELVHGIPITRYCDEENLATAPRLTLFVQVCQAIQHAHEKGVIHRDIKPSNILVTMHDDVAVPKVIDFGIAKAAQGRLTDQTAFTAFEQFIGTPAYMSPEQAQYNDLGVDARSDIYSLGVLLYELLTGRPPFDPKALQQSGLDEIRRIIREVDPPPPSTQLSTLGETDRAAVAKRRATAPAQLTTLLRGDLDWIVMRALEKNRTRRYATARGLAADIGRHLRNEPVTARPPSIAYRSQKFAARHRAALLGGAVALASLLAGLELARVSFRGDRAPSPGRAAEGGMRLAEAPAGAARGPAAGRPGGPEASEAVTLRRLPLEDPRRVFDVSPDGAYLAFAPYGRNPDVAIYDIAAGKTRTLVKGTEKVWTWNGACFSPDSRRLAYDLAGRTIHVAAVDGTGTRQVFKGEDRPGEWLEVVGWSPDARRLLVVRDRSGDPAAGATNLLDAIDLATGEWRQIATLADGNYRLAPDARTLAVRHGHALPSRKLALLDLATRRETALVESEVRDVVGWSPDGGRVLFTSDRTGTMGLWAVTVQDGRPVGDVELIRANLPDTSIAGIDGAGNIYYTEERNSINVYVMAANLATGEIVSAPRRVVDRFPGEQSLPVWSKDGQTMLLAIQRAQSRFLTVSLASGQQTDYPVVTDGIAQVGWSEPGGFLLFEGDLAGEKYGIQRYDLASGKIQTLLEAESDATWITQPELTRDGASFYYIRRETFKGADQREDWRDRIQRREFGSGTDEVVHEGEKLAAWLPLKLSFDGRHLAYVLADEATIKVFSLEDRVSRAVLRPSITRGLRSIAWTPDGRRILYTAGAEIWSVDVASGQSVKLQIAQVAIREVAVHPDGRQIAFRAGRFAAAREVWVMGGLLGTGTTRRSPGRLLGAIPLEEIAGPNRTMIDRQRGVMAALPADWTIASATRMRDPESPLWQGDFISIVLAHPPADPAEVRVRFGYQVYDAPKPLPAPEGGNWLRQRARAVDMLRKRQAGVADFAPRPASYSSRTIGGRPALSWVADFRNGGNDCVEYATLIRGEGGQALISLQTPAADFAALRPALEVMIESVRLP